ncbi:hypothetical protein ACGF13_19385 [Kitasatospora sp. NPDC048286]|uniref:hypothetical protein n=1 Tax=Kitasatospora sp. NPDC048286 TaxID=3364047 RepID=UPI003714DDD2
MGVQRGARVKGLRRIPATPHAWPLIGHLVPPARDPLDLPARHPEIERRLHREVDTVLRARPATYADLPRLEHLPGQGKLRPVLGASFGPGDLRMRAKPRQG